MILEAFLNLNKPPAWWLKFWVLPLLLLMGYFKVLEFFIQERIVKAVAVATVIRAISFKIPQGTFPYG